MELILLERVQNLGAMGDVVKVRDGYGRNYLLPLKKALRATEANKKVFEAKKAELAALNAEGKAAAEAAAKKFEGFNLSLVRQASDDGRLYGSVTTRDIADGLKEAGFTVERKQIDLKATIKTAGDYKANVVLHPEVVVTIGLTIARTEGEQAPAEVA